MFKHIVVALDGSDCAGRALEAGLGLAKMTGATLAICSVADPSPLYGALEPPVLVERSLEEIRSEARRVVDDALAKAQAAGVSAKGFTPEGEPVYEIISCATSIKADGIVIGTHGRSGIGRLFMGSIAEGVMRQATMPVVTVREEARLCALHPEAVS
jgi:nucleotide-binding universal stress UspA family protein